jgi:hypothetical protein
VLGSRKSDPSRPAVLSRIRFRYTASGGGPEPPDLPLPHRTGWPRKQKQWSNSRFAPGTQVASTGSASAVCERDEAFNLSFAPGAENRTVGSQRPLAIGSRFRLSGVSDRKNEMTAISLSPLSIALVRFAEPITGALETEKPGRAPHRRATPLFPMQGRTGSLRYRRHQPGFLRQIFPARGARASGDLAGASAL